MSDQFKDVPTIDEFLVDAADFANVYENPAARAILDAPPTVQITRLCELFARIAGATSHSSPNIAINILGSIASKAPLMSLASAILKRDLEYTQDDLESLLISSEIAARQVFPTMSLPLKSMLTRVDQYAYLNGLSPEMIGALDGLDKHLHMGWVRDGEEIKKRIERLLGPKADNPWLDETPEIPDLPESTASIEASLLLSAFINEVANGRRIGSHPILLDFEQYQSARAINEATALVQAAIVAQATEIVEAQSPDEPLPSRAARYLIQRMIRRPRVYETRHLVTILTGIAVDPFSLAGIAMDGTLSKLVTAHKTREGLDPSLVAALERCRYVLARLGPDPPYRPLPTLMNELMGELQPGLMEPGEPWADRALSDLAEMSEEVGANWRNLVGLAFDAKAKTPTRTWHAKAAKNVERVGRKEFLARTLAWFQLIGSQDCALTERNARVVKGIVWHWQAIWTGDFVQPITELASAAFTKIPKLGPKSKEVGYACLGCLEENRSEETDEALFKLLKSVKYPVVEEKIDNILKSRGLNEGHVTARERRRLRDGPWSLGL